MDTLNGACRGRPVGDSMNQANDFCAEDRAMYLRGYMDANDVVYKLINQLLQRQRYGFDIDSRRLIEEMTSVSSDISYQWNYSVTS